MRIAPLRYALLTPNARNLGGPRSPTFGVALTPRNWRRVLTANPAISIFTGIRLGDDRRPDTEALDRERRRGFVVVRLRIGLEDELARPAVVTEGAENGRAA